MARHQSKARRRRLTVPIRWQLLGATVVVGAVAVAIAVSGLQRMHVLNQRMNQIVDVAAEVELASLIRQEGEPLGDEAEAILNDLIEKSEARMAQLQAESSSQYAQARNSLLMISILGIVLSVAVSFHAGQRIARNLAKLANYARDIQDASDLSKRVPRVSDDEVGMVAEALDQMRKTVYRQTRELALMNDNLEQKNEEMEQFVYMVSHDLKSPLVSCKGLLGLMKEDIVDANYQEVVNSAERLEAATDQLNQIIDDLLALSRIGRKSLELSNIDMAGMLTELLSQLANREEATHVTMTVVQPIPNLLADVRDVKRAFENLLTNAIKYAGDVPQPVIEVGGRVHDGEAQYYVKDNGPGIEPEYHERIFELFQRLDTSKEGTGLGLGSVTKIMRMYGGRVWVESSPGGSNLLARVFEAEPMTWMPDLTSGRR